MNSMQNFPRRKWFAPPQRFLLLNSEASNTETLLQRCDREYNGVVRPIQESLLLNEMDIILNGTNLLQYKILHILGEKPKTQTSITPKDHNVMLGGNKGGNNSSNFTVLKSTPQ